MDGSDGSDGDDGSDGSDDSGPGFGILSAATGIGGAGYLLKQRLGNPDETE
jgi:hypothetical protein